MASGWGPAGGGALPWPRPPGARRRGRKGGSTATGRRQREEPTDDGEDGRDPGEKQEDAVGEVGEVVVASAKLEAKRRGRGGRRRQWPCLVEVEKNFAKTFCPFNH